MAAKKTILIVDDSLTMRSVIKRELGDEFYLFKDAKNGQEALRIIEEGTIPDLITLDIDMPQMDGFETCKRIYEPEFAKRFPNHKDGRVPILFVTSCDNINDRKRGFELGAVDFVSKPFEPGHLKAIVTKILNPTSRLKEITALVVDDSKSARSLVSRGLREEGITVIEAEDGAKAYEIICNKMSQIDIVVTDIEMPCLTGGELCKKIRKELGMVDIPIIFFSGIADRTMLLEVFSAGGTDYLIKPFIKEEMVARILVHVEKTQLNISLRKSVEELRENIRIKNDMIAALSHDMRTPLNGIIGFSNLLLDSNTMALDDRENIILIKESGRMLLNIINDILALSKAHAQQGQLEMKPISLLDVAQKSIGALTTLAELKHHKLEFHQSITRPVIIGNQDALMRVLNNLIGNSIKFTPERGTISLNLTQVGDTQIAITVSDTGVGIAPEKLPYLFDKFSRISKKGTAGEASTGLGMSIVKEIIEKHGGKIEVTSTVGAGTRITLTFPCAENQRLNETPEGDDNRELKNTGIIDRIKGLKVLIAEDNPVNQQIARLMLSKSGCIVQVAPNGQEAIRMYSENPKNFQLILMDMEMPVMDGLAASRALRASGYTSIPIIAMTANARDEDRTLCLQAGMNEFITKPINPAIILEKLGKFF